MYLIYVSPLDYELYECKNSNWLKKKQKTFKTINLN